MPCRGKGEETDHLHAGEFPDVGRPHRQGGGADAKDLGIPAVLLFGIPDKKDETRLRAYGRTGSSSGPREIKDKVPDILVITDVCLCEYTSHGHCGMLEEGEVDNDTTLELLAETALSHAKAGADMVAPSAMMDGQVGAHPRGARRGGFREPPIMAYSAKYASCFYGPFREAAESAPQFGDRKGLPDGPGQQRRGDAGDRPRR